MQQLLLPTNEFISSNTTLVCHIFILYSSRQYFYKILLTFFISLLTYPYCFRQLFYRHIPTPAAAKDISPADTAAKLAELVALGRSRISQIFLHWTAGHYVQLYDDHHFNIDAGGHGMQKAAPLFKRAAF